MTKKRDLIAAIDAGTTGTRCCIFDGAGNLISSGYVPMRTFHRGPGLAEQDPDEIIRNTFRAVSEAVSSGDFNPSDIIGVCTSAIRNSFVPIGRDGQFLTDLILWQDQRGEKAHPWILECLKKSGMTPEEFFRINAQPFGSFQCGFKALWFRKFREDLYEKTYKLITPQAMLMRAFGAEGYPEENNNQNFWLMADADSQTIRKDLCRIFDFDPGKFPEALTPGTRVGTVSKEAARLSLLMEGTPLYIGSGDQQCGALGAGNYGTPDIMSVCLGTAGLCIAYSPGSVRHPNGKCQVQGHPAGGYQMEAHSSSCMSSWKWAGDILFPDAGPAAVNERMTEAAKRSPAGARGVLFLPWLAGAACPHYDDTAKGAYIGLTLASSRDDLVRASMEGICFENREMLETLQEASLPQAKTLRILGGASGNDFWNQMQADIYGVPVETVTAKEASALGAAVICAVSSGLHENFRQASEKMTYVKNRLEPDRERREQYNEIYKIWAGCYQGISSV